jgi:pimeloyl-ACP methyl ester carboxylesterase
MPLHSLAYLLLVSLFIVANGGTDAGAAEKVGVVLMHGKTGTAMPRSPVGQLRTTLESAGFMVETPQMPWSSGRMLASDYEASMNEIDEAVKTLRAAGATRIVVGGTSMGANAALGYGARRDGIAGILALAPGHTPDSIEFQSAVDSDYKRAKDMVAAGKGAESADFKDVNQGRRSTITTTAAIYLSWFDPEGSAAMPKNTARLKPGVALLWLVGDKDPMARRGEAYAYAQAPKNPKSAYVVIDSNHRDTPIDGANKIVELLKAL